MCDLTLYGRDSRDFEEKKHLRGVREPDCERLRSSSAPRFIFGNSAGLMPAERGRSQEKDAYMSPYNETRGSTKNHK